jgi:dephospho-CoA kinase
MSVAFAFCGSIGSGKSAVSRRFANRFAGAWNSFGNTVKLIATERAIEPSRENLQQIGAALVETEPENFCRRVLAGATDSQGSSEMIVIDGVRHRSILDHLRRLFTPNRLICVFVDAPLNIRVERLKDRDGLSEAQVLALQKHSTEVEVECDLRAAADFVADNSGSLDHCENELVGWAIQQRLVTRPAP